MTSISKPSIPKSPLFPSAPPISREWQDFFLSLFSFLDIKSGESGEFDSPMGDSGLNGVLDRINRLEEAVNLGIKSAAANNDFFLWEFIISLSGRIRDYRVEIPPGYTENLVGVTNQKEANDWTDQSAASKAWVLDLTETTYFPPDTVTFTVGAGAGTFPDDVLAIDATVYRVDEVTGAPGIDHYYEFTDIDDFNAVIITAYYSAAVGAHSIALQVYDWDGATWETYHSLTADIALKQHSFRVLDPTNHIGTGANAGKVRLRFYHAASGNPSHDLYVGYAALAKLGMGGGASTAGNVTVNTTPLTENLAGVTGNAQAMFEAIDQIGIVQEYSSTVPQKLNDVVGEAYSAGYDRIKGCDEVLGANGFNYICVLSHTATADDEPGVGVNWGTYWQRGGRRGITWLLGTAYDDGATGFFQASPNQVDVRIVCLGDSNTWGKFAPMHAYAQPYWWEVLQGQTREQNWYWINQGVGGSTSTSALARFYRDVELRFVPGAINKLVIVLGVNDAIASVADTAYYANIEGIVDRAQAIGYSEVYVCHYPPYHNHPTESALITDYNTKIATENALRADPFIEIDLNSAVSSDGFDWDDPTLLNVDELHWEAQGQYAISQLIAPYVLAKNRTAESNKFSYSKNNRIIVDSASGSISAGAEGDALTYFGWQGQGDLSSTFGLWRDNSQMVSSGTGNTSVFVDKQFVFTKTGAGTDALVSNINARAVCSAGTVTQFTMLRLRPEISGGTMTTGLTYARAATRTGGTLTYRAHASDDLGTDYFIHNPGGKNWFGDGIDIGGVDTLPNLTIDSNGRIVGTSLTCSGVRFDQYGLTITSGNVGWLAVNGSNFKIYGQARTGSLDCTDTNLSNLTSFLSGTYAATFPTLKLDDSGSIYLLTMATAGLTGHRTVTWAAGGDVTLNASSLSTMQGSGTAQDVSTAGSPQYNGLIFDGQAARTLRSNRNTTSDTAGNDLTLQSGGATSGATDKNGGNLILLPGETTNTGKSALQFGRFGRAATTGTTDNTSEIALWIPSMVWLTIDGATNNTVFTFNISSSRGAGGVVPFTLVVFDTSSPALYHTVTGLLKYSGARSSSGNIVSVAEELTTSEAKTGITTLTLLWTTDTGTTTNPHKIMLKVTQTGMSGTISGWIRFEVFSHSNQVITAS